MDSVGIGGSVSSLLCCWNDNCLIPVHLSSWKWPLPLLDPRSHQALLLVQSLS